jgi:endogenous inhibitor of DNA gyrase (YacG/DUF329 family)
MKTANTTENPMHDDCPHCDQPIQAVTKFTPFCSRKCWEADARDARETEADKWEMRYEM